MYTQFSLSDFQKRQVTLDSCNRWSSKRSVADKGDVPENSAVGVRELSLHKSQCWVREQSRTPTTTPTPSAVLLCVN